MKRVLLICLAASAGLLAQGQTFILPTSTERVAPSASGTPSAASGLLTNDVFTLSNTDYNSTVTSQIIKIAGWSKDYSSGPGGGFAYGYDDLSGLPLITNTVPLANAVDLHVGFMEHPSFSKTYAVVAYYDYSSAAYVCQLYDLAGSATPLFTKTLMTSAYNRISMDILGGKIAAFTWSDGTDVYTAVGKINGATDQLDFSPSLSSPAITLTGGSYNQTLPDVAVAGFNSPAKDSVYYTYYNDSAAQVNLIAMDLDDLLTTSSSSYAPPVRDYNTVSHSVFTELDVPESSAIEVWGYTYADGYVKVRHKAPTLAPVTITINNGSLLHGPAAMSLAGTDYHPVIAYPTGIIAAYALGWSTTRSTNPYAYPHSGAMVYVLMDARDSLASKKDYQLINSFPGATSPVYAFAPVSFSTQWKAAAGLQKLYACYLHAAPGYAPWAELVNKNHAITTTTSFKLADASEQQSLTVAPNPSSSSFRLISNTTIDPDSQIDIVLTDIMGRCIMQYSGTLPDINIQLSNTAVSLPAGSYIITTGYAGKRQEIKVQKIAE